MSIKQGLIDLYDGIMQPQKVYEDYQLRKEPTMADPLVDQLWHQMTDTKAKIDAVKLAQAQALYAQQQAQALYANQANYGAIVSGTGLAQGVYGGGYAIPNTLPGGYTSITNYPNGAGQLINQWPPAPPSIPTYPPGLAVIWADMRTQAANGNWEKVLVYINWISQLTRNFGGQFDGNAVGQQKDTSHDPIFSLSELEQAQDLVEEIEGSRA